MRLVALFILSLSFMAVPLAAQPVEVSGIEIVEFGFYSAKVDRTEESSKTPVGYINWVTDIRLLEHTDEFCAKMNLRFGVEFRVLGQVAGSLVALEMVTRFPPQGVIDKAGKRFEKSEFVQTATIGEVSARTFSFDEVREMVPGVWTFEFHHLGRKIGEKKFTILPSCPIS